MQYEGMPGTDDEVMNLLGNSHLQNVKCLASLTFHLCNQHAQHDLMLVALRSLLIAWQMC